MNSNSFVAVSLALASLAGCAAHEEDLELAEDFVADEDPQLRVGVSPYVRPDFLFRFDASVPATVERAAADSSNYSLTQDLPVGPVVITGTVRYDDTTKIATFSPDADLDSRYPYEGLTGEDITPWVDGQPEDTVQAPCLSTDAFIDGVPVSDGIPSCHEQPGTWYKGQPLAYWGADPNQVDMFIEVDYYNVDPATPGATPQWGALDRVRQAFLARGYHVHFDVGDLFSSTYADLANFNLGGGDPMGVDQGIIDNVASVDMVTLDPTAACPVNGITNINQNNFITKYRRQSFTNQGREHSFYYFAFLSEVEDDQASAQLEGSNAALPFGHSDWTDVFNAQLAGTPVSQHLANANEPLLNLACTHQFCNQIINYQAGTIMHELGHNLGLRHHGGPGISMHTPNYWSVMSYQYQTFGLPPDPATYEGDRFFFALDTKCNNAQHPTTKADLERGPLSSWKLTDPDHFIIDYSDGLLPPMWESATDESLGVDGQEGPSIDWNCDNVDNGGPADLNGYGGINGGQNENPLVDNDDWGTLELYHAHWYSQGELPNDGFPYPCPFNE